MKIGILQTGHVSDKMISATGDYGEIFQRFLHHDGVEFDTYSVVDMDFPSSADAAQGWLITGSKHGAYDPLPFIPKLEALVREIYQRRQPLVGICFGHQIIAQALGGRVEKFSGGWSVGHTSYTLEGQPVSLNAWHQDQVVQCPSEAHILGSSDFCKYAFLGYGDHVFTVQAHPEFNSDFIQGLITYRAKGIVPDPLLNEASEKLALPNNNTQMRERILNLFLSAMVSS